MSLRNNIKQVFFYRACLFCQQKLSCGNWFCCDCSLSLPRIEHPCRICATPGSYDGICGNCLNNPPYYDCALVPFEFKTPVNKLIHQFKYSHQFHAYKPLIQDLLELISISNQSLPDLIIPIPLHPRRLITRGFNQSSLIAKTLSKQLNIPYSNRLLIRHKYSKPQVQLSARQREKAVKNVFQLKQKINVHHIVLVDDVITTSHTVNQAAKILTKSGIEKVSVWALARNT